MRRRDFLASIAASAAAIGANACRRSKIGVDAFDAATSKIATRVVSISASTTETLFAIGAGAFAVGRSRYCDYPPDALKLPTIGGYTDPNLEAILSLHPDLVVGARGPIGPSIVRSIEDHGIATYFPETERFADILTMIEGIGDRTGHGDDARRLTNDLREEKAALEKKFAPLSKPRVLLVFAAHPASVAGPSSFPDEMLTLAGARNAVTTGNGYPTLPLESVIAIDPDLVVVAEMGGTVGPLDGAWTSVPAVEKGHVVHIDDVRVLRPGPRVLEGVELLARAIHG
jgi:iron complex transport system substrate-binding protein